MIVSRKEGGGGGGGGGASKQSHLTLGEAMLRNDRRYYYCIIRRVS